MNRGARAVGGELHAAPALLRLLIAQEQPPWWRAEDAHHGSDAAAQHPRGFQLGGVIFPPRRRSEAKQGMSRPLLVRQQRGLMTRSV